MNSDTATRAREAWAKLAAGKRWTLWVRLSFAKRVREATAHEVLWEWSTQLRREMLGTALLFGVHDDTDCLHAHALIYIPRRFADPYRPPGCSFEGPSWEQRLQATWRFGQVWAVPYDSTLITEGSPHGAAEYLARDPGSVVRVGTAPALKMH